MLSSTYQSTDSPLLSTLYKPLRKHLISVLVGQPGAYRLAKPLDSLQGLATVHAVLAARIDRLPAEEKRLLQTAAVIGTEVPLPCCRPLPSCPKTRCTVGAPPGGRISL